MANIISITADGEDFVVRNPVTDITTRISWPDLSNIYPGLKLRCECIGALLRSVGGNYRSGHIVTGPAEDLIEKATEAACQLY